MTNKKFRALLESIAEAAEEYGSESRHCSSQEDEEFKAEIERLINTAMVAFTFKPLVVSRSEYFTIKDEHGQPKI